MTLSKAKRELEPLTVHVWTLHLDEREVPRRDLEGLLSADERSRAARFHFERDRQRFILARAHLRQVLAAYTGMNGARLTFSYSPYGKPRLQNAPIDIRFNVSHSDAMALFAITCGREIGVDLEKMRPEVEIDELAGRFFSPMEAEVLSTVAPASRVAAFFRTWSCKEAFVKAQGMGLAMPLDCFDVEVRISEPAALLATRPDPNQARQWSLRLLDIVPGYAAALAVLGQIQELSVFPVSAGFDGR